MQKYEEDLAARLNGNNLQPLAGAEVRVTSKATGLPASLYQDDELTLIPQPIITSDTGYFSFRAADGKYLVTYSGVRFATFTREIILEDPADNPYLTAQELALQNGASKVGFQQLGTSAVARTAEGKLRDTVSAFDFMTAEQVNNCWLRIGTVDVTAAIQAALNAVAAGGLALHFPAAVYSVTGGITGPRNVVVTGDGWQSVIKLADGANAAHIIKFGDESDVTTVELHDIALDGNKANNPTAGDGLVIVRGYKANLHNVRVANCAADGVQYEATGSCFENYIFGLSSYSNGGYGLRMTGNVTDTHIVGGDIGNNATGGIVLATSCSVDGATIWGAGQQFSTGIVTAGLSFQIFNCKIEGHGKHGIHVGAGNHYGLIEGNKIYANAFNVATTGTYDGIYVEAGANYGTVTGNKVYSSLSGASPYNMRYALNFAGAHNQWTIASNDFGLLVAPGSLSGEKVVNGILATDKTDSNWIRTDIRSQITANVNATAAFAWTAFPFNNDVADPLSEHASGVFTPKHSGMYHIEAAFTCIPAAAGEQLGIGLYTNTGTSIRRLAFICAASTGSVMVSGTIEEYLQAGTAYDIRYIVGSTSTQFQAGAQFTYLRIRAVPN